MLLCTSADECDNMLKHVNLYVSSLLSTLYNMYIITPIYIKRHKNTMKGQSVYK